MISKLPKSILFNLPKINTPNSSKFYTRLSSILWSGEVLENVNDYIFPEIFAILEFSNLDQLDKQFTVMTPEALTETLTLSEYSQEIESSYIKDSPYTGDSSYLKNLQAQINQEFIDVGV